MSTSVKVFASTDSGAPVLSGTAGALIAVLDACLQDGYGEVTIDSLVVASNVATVTDSTGHGFTMLGAVGPVVRISGATPAGLNGDWRITVTSATQFTFTTSGITDQTASGTIVVKRAPAGFTKEFSGTNLAAYRSDDVTGTRLYLRVNDTGTTTATTIMYEVMTDMDTGTGLAPTSGSVYVGKSATANSTARPWRLVADGKLFYLFVNSTSAWESGLCFGDINSYRSGDAYHCYLCGGQSNNVVLYLSDFNDNTSNSYLSRAYHQTGAAITSGRYSHRKCDVSGYGGQEAPSFTDNALHFWPIEAWESTTRARGLMPGLYCPVHNGNPENGTVIDNVPVISGSVLIQQTVDATLRFGINITGAWR